VTVVEVTVSAMRDHGLYWNNTMPPGAVVAADPGLPTPRLSRRRSAYFRKRRSSRYWIRSGGRWAIG